MDSWKIVFGSKVTDVNLVGEDGKEKKVAIHCDRSDMNTVQRYIEKELTPLDHGNYKGVPLYGRKKILGYFFLVVSTHEGAVELRDKIRAVLDEYAAYLAGKPENTGGSAGNTGGGTPESDKSGGNNTPTPDEPEGETDFSGIAIVIVIALILYLVLWN